MTQPTNLLRNGTVYDGTGAPPNTDQGSISIRMLLVSKCQRSFDHGDKYVRLKARTEDAANDFR